ncbi:MAG: hypothetical protein ACLGJA_02595 [Gammaproteobacteria bacterium]
MSIAKVRERLELIDRMSKGGESLDPVFHERDVRSLLAEIDQLKADNEALANRLENVCRVGGIKQGTLLTGIEALRKDAERYQWLRDKSESVHPFYLSVPIWVTGVRFRKEDVDSSIDTAMAKERGQ